MIPLGLSPDRHSLIGTLISFLLLLGLLPRWTRLRWRSGSAWTAVGLRARGCESRRPVIPALFGGMVLALILLGIVLLLCCWAAGAIGSGKDHWTESSMPFC